MAVVENVVFSVNQLKAAMVVCSKAGRHIGRFIGINMHVYITYNYASVAEALSWVFTCCITELVHNLRRKYEIISISNLSDRRCFEESMVFIALPVFN